jgi:hypothetical protein
VLALQKVFNVSKQVSNVLVSIACMIAIFIREILHDIRSIMELTRSDVHGTLSNAFACIVVSCLSI